MTQKVTTVCELPKGNWPTRPYGHDSFDELPQCKKKCASELPVNVVFCMFDLDPIFLYR